MEYLKWMLVTILMAGFLDTGFSKSTATDDYDDLPQDEEDDYNDSSKNIEIPQTVHSNDVPIVSRPYFPVPSITVNVTKGEDAILHCDVKNLQAQVQYVIMWYNGSQVIASGTHNSGNVLGNKEKIILVNWPTIKIQNVEYNDRNQYICSVVNYATLTVLLNVIQPRAVAIYSHARDLTDRSMTFRQGDPVEFECRVTGVQNATIKWSLNGERAINHVTKIDGGKVIINAIDAHQAGVYQCLGDDGTEKNLPHGSVTINVQYAPKVSTHRHYVNTMEGDDAEMYCDYMAEPIAITEWRRYVSKRYETIPTVSDKYLIRNTFHEKRNRTILVIKNVNENDLGEYQCYVKNAINSAHVKIHLIYEPETPQFEDFELNKKTVNVYWLVKSKQPIVEAAVDYKLNGTHNKWMTESVTKNHTNEHTGIWKLTHELQLAPGKWHVRMKVKNTVGWSKFSNEHDIFIPEDPVDTPPDDIIYAGDIAGAKIANNNANQIIKTVPFYLILCLLSLSIFNVVPLH